MMSVFNSLRLSPWYLNTRRLNALIGGGIPTVAQTSLIKNSAERSDGMARALYAADDVLKSERIPSLISIYDDLSTESSALCYIWDVLTFRGVGAALSQERSGNLKTPASFNGTIQIDQSPVKVYGKFSNDHVYSSSSTDLMSGRKRALLIGQAQKDEAGGVRMHSYVVGDMEVDFGEFSMSWRNSLRVHPEQIDAFSKIRNFGRVSTKNVREMLNISEEEVKNALADIIGEPFVPKDWGGEKSDLSTNHISVMGEPFSGAFILKGPSVPGTLYVSNMGKRGDQLMRAFDEPVEVIFIQHCAKIDNAVVRTAETFAANPSNPKRYCILDGAETCRILMAYGKFPKVFSN